MITTQIVAATPTTTYLGVCDPCQRPVRATLTGGNGTDHTPCPDCGQQVRVERLIAVTTEGVCDGRCMGAYEPSCSCPCGGENHGKHFGPRATHEELESAVEAYRAGQARTEAKRTAKRDAERTAAEEWADEHADVIDYLRTARYSDFIESLTDQLDRRGSLSERQVAAVRRGITRDAERAARDAEFRANAKPVPTGKAVQVEGTVLKVDARDGYAYGTSDYVMTVECDGYRVWTRVPKALQGSANLTIRNNYFALVGGRVRFTADITASDRDENFGFAKRPRKAERVFQDRPAVAGDLAIGTSSRDERFEHVGYVAAAWDEDPEGVVRLSYDGYETPVLAESVRVI